MPVSNARLRRAFAVSLLLSPAILTRPAHAEIIASSTADDAEDIIVVGQRNAPINIEPRGLAVSLGQEQFAGVNAFNVEDLMKYAPNFFVRKRFAYNFAAKSIYYNDFLWI